MTGAPGTTVQNEEDDKDWDDFVLRFEGYEFTEFENISPLTPYSKARTGDTMLHIVILREETDDARLLLRRGASPNEPGELGFTPLHMAALKRNLALLKMLLTFGADISQLNDFDQTAIEVARLGEFEEGAVLLENWISSRTDVPRQ